MGLKFETAYQPLTLEFTISSNRVSKVGMILTDGCNNKRLRGTCITRFLGSCGGIKGNVITITDDEGLIHCPNIA